MLKNHHKFLETDLLIIRKYGKIKEICKILFEVEMYKIYEDAIGEHSVI